MVLVGLKPGSDQDYYGSPPTYSIGSLCKIVNEERLAHDQGYNLFLHCVARVRIQTIHQLMPYRTAEVEVIPDDPGASEEVLAEAMTRLIAAMRGLILELGDQSVALSSVLTATSKPSILTHRLATVIATSPADKQALLETPSVHTRAERLTELATDLLLRSTAVQVAAQPRMLN